MGRNNKDFHQDMPGFEGTLDAFNSLVSSGKSIIDKRKEKSEEDMIEDSFAQADMERGK